MLHGVALSAVLCGKEVKMQMILPIKCFWVTCREDEDLNEEFGVTQFDEADDYLNQQRELWPGKQIEMIAEIEK